MELIRIYQGNLIEAEELHQFLEIKTPYKDWVNRSLIKHFKVDKDFFAKLRESTGGRRKTNYHLTIDTAKKLAMMAKTSKGDEAREYFLECEKAIVELKQNKRFEAFFKLEATKDRLRANIEDIGGTHQDFIQVDLEGRKVLFNGEPVADEELHIVLLKGRDFATELTNINLNKEGDYSIQDVEELNKAQHKRIRNAIIDGTGVTPEEMPTEERIKKLGE